MISILQHIVCVIHQETRKENNELLNERHRQAFAVSIYYSQVARPV